MPNTWEPRPLGLQLSAEFEALDLVESLFDRPFPKEDVIESVRADKTISEQARQSAFAFAKAWHEDPEVFKRASWNITRRPGAGEEKYRQALVLKRYG